MAAIERIFFMSSEETILPVSPEQYQKFMRREPGVAFADFAGRRLKTAHVQVEVPEDDPALVLRAEFRYTALDDQGRLDPEDVQSFITLGAEAIAKGTDKDPQGEYRRKHFWTPTEDQFKILMKLALDADIGPEPRKVETMPAVARDRSDPKLESICSLIDQFGGLQVVGSNLTMDHRAITFDIVSPEGLVALLFLVKGRRLEMADSLKFTLQSPNRDMRYVLSMPRADDYRKVGLWLVAIYQKRLTYEG